MTAQQLRLAAAAQAAKSFLAPRAGIAAAFLAGSVVEGYGNPMSDIDVLVLVDEGTPDTHESPVGTRTFHFKDCLIEICFHDDERLDVESRSLARFRGLLTGLGALPMTQQGACEVDEFTFQFLHQLRCGLDLIGAPLLAELREAVAWSRVTELLRLRRQSDYVGYAEDAAGAIQAEDASTALLTSRRALGSAIDCLTAALGHTNPKEKWRYRKLVDLGRNDLVDRCLGLECDTHPTPAALLAGARRRLVASQGLVTEAVRAT